MPKKACLFQKHFSLQMCHLRRLAPEVAQPGHFFCGTPLPFTLTTHVNCLPYNPPFSFSDIHLTKYFKIVIAPSIHVYVFTLKMPFSQCISMKNLEECFSRQNLKSQYLHNEAYDIYYLTFFCWQLCNVNKNINFKKMS